MTTNIDALLAQASQLANGLTDFGDPSFREGLEVFLESASTDGQLTDIGTAAAEGMALGNLVNRLNVVEWHRTHPDLASMTVDSPIFLIAQISRTTQR